MCGQNPSRPTQDSGRKGIDLRSICQPPPFCRICLRCPVSTKDSLCCTSSRRAAVLCTLTISQKQVMATILPTISTAHSASSSQSRLTLLHKLLVVLCTLTISKNRTMTTILPPRISTAHSTSESRPMVIHLAPAAWHFHSGHSSCLRVRKTFGTSFQTRQKTFSNSRESRCRINRDPGDWYLMAAYARHHLLPFGNYMLYYFRRLVPDGSIRSPPPTPIWKLNVTLFSRSFPREDGE
jgi:hypothetical protein